MSEQEIRYDDPVLCYVDGNCAYFTTRQLDKQWGDDWNDTPYEYNAETPYEWSERYDVEPYAIVKVFYVADAYQTPSEWQGGNNSSFSVQMINENKMAWLYPSRYWRIEHPPILAGTPLSDFRRMIWASGGNVYERTLSGSESTE